MTPPPAAGRSVLLIVGGGIAAYKALELVRLLKKAGIGVTPILTAGGAQFVTPMSLGVLAGVLTPFFDTPLQRAAAAHPNLGEYVARMMQRYYPAHVWPGRGAR